MCMRTPRDKCSPRPATARAWAELVERLRALAPALIAVEATGGSKTVVVAALAGEALPVVVVNPAQVRHYAQALGKRAKTDPIDAAVIARFAEATKPAVRALPDEMTRQLGDLVARRRQIVEMLGAEGERQRRASDKRVKKSIARLRKALEKALADIDAEIDDNVRGSPVWAEKEDLLASVPGVGPVVGLLRLRKCRSLERSTAARSPRWRALRPSLGNRASGRARASSAAGARACAASCSWPPWSPPASIRSSRRSATDLSPPENPSSSLS